MGKLESLLEEQTQIERDASAALAQFAKTHTDLQQENIRLVRDNEKLREELSMRPQAVQSLETEEMIVQRYKEVMEEIRRKTEKKLSLVVFGIAKGGMVKPLMRFN